MGTMFLIVVFISGSFVMLCSCIMLGIFTAKEIKKFIGEIKND